MKGRISGLCATLLGALPASAPALAGETECNAVRTAYQTSVKHPHRITSTLTAQKQRWEDIYIGDAQYSLRGQGGWQKKDIPPGARESALASMKYSDCEAEGQTQLPAGAAKIYSFVLTPPNAPQPNPRGRIWVDARDGRILRFESHAIRMDYSYSGIKPPI